MARTRQRRSTPSAELRATRIWTRRSATSTCSSRAGTCVPTTSPEAHLRCGSQGEGATTFSIPDGAGTGRFLIGTFELDVIEGTGIYRSIVGGHNHMDDILHFSSRRWGRHRRTLLLHRQRPITPVETRYHRDGPLRRAVRLDGTGTRTGRRRAGSLTPCLPRCSARSQSVARRVGWPRRLCEATPHPRFGSGFVRV